MEKIYKSMGSVGSFNIVTGILMIVFGIAFGTAVIARGVTLLKRKSELIF